MEKGGDKNLKQRDDDVLVFTAATVVRCGPASWAAWEVVRVEECVRPCATEALFPPSKLRSPALEDAPAARAAVSRARRPCERLHTRHPKTKQNIAVIMEL